MSEALGRLSALDLASVDDDTAQTVFGKVRGGRKSDMRPTTLTANNSTPRASVFISSFCFQGALRFVTRQFSALMLMAPASCRPFRALSAALRPAFMHVYVCIYTNMRSERGLAFHRDSGLRRGCCTCVFGSQCCSDIDRKLSGSCSRGASALRRMGKKSVYQTGGQRASLVRQVSE